MHNLLIIGITDKTVLDNSFIKSERVKQIKKKDRKQGKRDKQTDRQRNMQTQQGKVFHHTLIQWCLGGADL